MPPFAGGGLESLQVFKQGGLVLIGKIRSKVMAAVTVAAQPRIEGASYLFGLGPLKTKPTSSGA
jgi:hypothetical protein